VLYEQAEPLDWAGPFEVYNDAGQFGRANGEPAFNVYIVSKTSAALDAQGVHVVPEYTIENAPKPDIVVFPGGPSSNVYDDPAFFAWADKASKEAEIAQSVCTGAFVLGKAGLLDGLTVTTFHGAIDNLQQSFPKAHVERGRRFVDNGHVVTTAGISAGIDGSLHVVARLLGRRVADETATYMEYAWNPEASLASDYPYMNPSTDDMGRLDQTGGMQFGEKNYPAAEKTFRTLTASNPANRDAWQSLGVVLKAEGKHAEAAEAMAKGIDPASGHMVARGWYEVAAEWAQAGHKDDAVAALQKSFDAGYKDRQRVATDPELASIAQDPRVRQLLAAK
jgi:putative intracellular protease/amidase